MQDQLRKPPRSGREETASMETKLPRKHGSEQEGSSHWLGARKTGHTGVHRHAKIWSPAPGMGGKPPLQQVVGQKVGGSTPLVRGSGTHPDTGEGYRKFKGIKCLGEEVTLVLSTWAVSYKTI